jgi:hypothetical protein
LKRKRHGRGKILSQSEIQLLFAEGLASTYYRCLFSIALFSAARINEVGTLFTEEAYEKGWLLSTKEVADLLELAPSTVCAYGQEFEDAGFVFTRAGTRKGGEIAWMISKAIGQ